MVCLYVCLCVCLGCFWVIFLGLGVSFKHHADTGKRVYVCVHQCVRAYVCVVCVYEPMYAHASVCMCMRAYVCICECIQEPLCTTSHIFTQTCINLVFVIRLHTYTLHVFTHASKIQHACAETSYQGPGARICAITWRQSNRDGSGRSAPGYRC
jgi:hypothetical protein